jgi:hypothetical protein
VQDAAVVVLGEDRLRAHDEPDLELDVRAAGLDPLRAVLGRPGPENSSPERGQRSAQVPGKRINAGQSGQARAMGVIRGLFSMIGGLLAGVLGLVKGLLQGVGNLLRRLF